MIDIDLKKFDVIYQYPGEKNDVCIKTYQGGLGCLVSYFKGFQEGDLSSMNKKLLEREKSRINGRILFLKKDLKNDVEIYSLELPEGTFNLLELCVEKGYQIINGDGDLSDSN